MLCRVAWLLMEHADLKSHTGRTCRPNASVKAGSCPPTHSGDVESYFSPKQLGLPGVVSDLSGTLYMDLLALAPTVALRVLIPPSFLVLQAPP